MMHDEIRKERWGGGKTIQERRQGKKRNQRRQGKEIRKRTLRWDGKEEEEMRGGREERLLFLLCMSHRQILLWLKQRYRSRPLLTYGYMPSTRLTHTHTSADTQVATAIFVGTFFECFLVRKCQGNSFSSKVHKTTLTRLQFTDTLTTNKIRTHNTLHCTTFDTKMCPVSCIHF